MSLVFAAILPHGPDVVRELAAEPAVMAETRAAMEEAGRRFASAAPEAVILLDPDRVHVQHAVALKQLRQGLPTPFPRTGEPTISVATAARAEGVAWGAGRCIRGEFACDVALAEAILNAGRDSLPVVPDSGKDDTLPLRWGTMIPLWFTVHPLPPPRPGLVVISPGPAVESEALLRFGGVLAEVARTCGKRVAMLASADQAHTHDRNNAQFGFSPAAAQHDAMFRHAVLENRLDRLLRISDRMLRETWADSLWATLILAGALRAVPMAVDLLSYAVPTYYGMAVAVYQPAPPSGGATAP